MTSREAGEDGVATMRTVGARSFVAKALPRAPQNNINDKVLDDPGEDVGLNSMPKDTASSGGSSKPRGMSVTKRFHCNA